jgi:hypothetical protein
MAAIVEPPGGPAFLLRGNAGGDEDCDDDPIMLSARRTASVRSTNARIGAVVLVLVVLGRVSRVGEVVVMGELVAVLILGASLGAGKTLSGTGIVFFGEASRSEGCGGIAA